MANQNPKLDTLLQSPQAADLIKNKDAVIGLAGSADAQKLMELLNKSSGGGLKSAADAAMKGDVSQLSAMMQQLIQSKEGAAVVDRINRAIPKK